MRLQVGASRAKLTRTQSNNQNYIRNVVETGGMYALIYLMYALIYS